MSAVHHSAFSNCFSVRERARRSRAVAELIGRQQSRAEDIWPKAFLTRPLHEGRRSLEARPAKDDCQ